MGLPTVDDALTLGLVNVVLGQTTDDEASPLSSLPPLETGTEFDEAEESDFVDPADNPGKWSSADPYSYQLLRQFVIDNFFGGETQGMSALIGAFVNDWAWSLAEKTTKVIDEVTGETREVASRWPSIDEIIGRADFIKGAQFLPYAGEVSDLIPPGGSEIFHDAETGQVVKVTFDLRSGLSAEPYDLGGNLARMVSMTPGEQLAADLERYTVDPSSRPLVKDADKFEGVVSSGVIDRLDPEAQAGLGREPVVNGRRIFTFPKVRPLTDLTGRLQPKAPKGPSRRGSSGAAPKLDWDRRKLTQMADEAYRSWMFEDAAESFTKGIVDGYINEATGFWKKSGGRILDYEAYVKEKLRATPRYKTIFRHKPDDVEEDAFIGQFASPIASMGLRPETGRREVERAVSSGGSVQGQVTRISRTREGSQSTGFGQRFARKVSELGAGVRV